MPRLAWPCAAHLSHSMLPLLSMRVCSSPSSRFCLLLLLFWPSQAVNLRQGRAGVAGLDKEALACLHDRPHMRQVQTGETPNASTCDAAESAQR